VSTETETADTMTGPKERYWGENSASQGESKSLA